MEMMLPDKFPPTEPGPYEIIEEMNDEEDNEAPKRRVIGWVIDGKHAWYHCTLLNAACEGWHLDHCQRFGFRPILGFTPPKVTP